MLSGKAAPLERGRSPTERKREKDSSGSHRTNTRHLTAMPDACGDARRWIGVVLLCGAASVGACDPSSTPVTPDATVAPEPTSRLDVVIETAFGIGARDATSRSWRLDWRAAIYGPNAPRQPSALPTQVLPGLPTPVRVLEIYSVLTGTDDTVLQTSSTSGQQLIDSRVGGNEIRPNSGIFQSYGGVFNFDTPPTAATRSQVQMKVRLLDGVNHEHEASATIAITYESPPVFPCTTGRGRTPVEVRITSSGFEPVVAKAIRGLCVTFVNVDSVQHDIKSDPHPAHSACPEFNVGVVAPGARVMSANLGTIGACAYHDDL